MIARAAFIVASSRASNGPGLRASVGKAIDCAVSLLDSVELFQVGLRCISTAPYFVVPLSSGSKSGRRDAEVRILSLAPTQHKLRYSRRDGARCDDARHPLSHRLGLPVLRAKELKHEQRAGSECDQSRAGRFDLLLQSRVVMSAV